jgi:DNA mismatch endonuclease (patch repair protein)
MADKHSKETRSYNMQQIKAKNTRPELVVRRYLFSQGLRFRIHVKNLPGSPDIVFKKFKTVVFVHGCFWHSHENCKYSVAVKSNKDYWNQKISKNIMRDRSAQLDLINQGWNVIVIWECQLKSVNHAQTLQKLYKSIVSRSS